LATLIALPLLAVLFGLLIVACFKLAHSHLLLATGTPWIAYGGIRVSDADSRIVQRRMQHPR
jgi:hypothetical protein